MTIRRKDILLIEAAMNSALKTLAEPNCQAMTGVQGGVYMALKVAHAVAQTNQEFDVTKFLERVGIGGEVDSPVTPCDPLAVRAIKAAFTKTIP